MDVRNSCRESGHWKVKWSQEADAGGQPVKPAAMTAGGEKGADRRNLLRRIFIARRAETRVMTLLGTGSPGIETTG